LHYDPLDNLLIQFVGRKRILLYPPSKSSSSSFIEDHDIFSQEAYGKSEQVSSWHYAGYNKTQYNTSPIDIEKPDYQTYPDFANAPVPIECILYPYHRGGGIMSDHLILALVSMFGGDEM